MGSTLAWADHSNRVCFFVSATISSPFMNKFLQIASPGAAKVAEGEDYSKERKNAQWGAGRAQRAATPSDERPPHFGAVEDKENLRLLDEEDSVDDSPYLSDFSAE